MNDETPTPAPSSTQQRNRRLLGGAALLGAGALAGGILAGSLSASADDSSSTAATQSGAATAAAPFAPGNGARGGSDPVRSDESAVSSANAAKLKAAALEAVPGGTVYRVETDAGDAAYEAHMTKADGTPVTVKFDKNLKVTAVEDGMGKGDPSPVTAG